jgi:aspartate aminotransferase
VTISKAMAEQLEKASWIRQMFEEGARLKAQLGEEAVCDFTLGNPNAAPPARFFEELRRAAADVDPAAHRYMTNAGLPETRRAVAQRVGQDHGVTLGERDVVMSCGAAGGLNVLFKVILGPGDEVIVLAPFFPEYMPYVGNHGGVVRVVETDAAFQPDIARIAEAVTDKTKAVLINSPNNPTGAIYPEAALAALGEVLRDAEERLGRPVYLIADEPYRHIVYGEAAVPSPFACHGNAVVVASVSKDLSLAGERLGYIVLSPELEDKDTVFAACATATRTLGFVNAPAFMQRVVAGCLDDRVDLSVYRRNRDALCETLRAAGFELAPPPGAFYLFPRCPTGDDRAWCARLREHRILTVPGSGFGRAGHLRLAYCVDPATVDRAAPLLVKAMAE